MKAKQSILEGVKIIIPEIHYDFRGEYVETYNKTSHDYFTDGLEFVVDDISVSRYGTIRGLHGDHKTWKLISCMHGEIMQFVIDLRRESPTFLRYQIFYVNDRNRHQILIPPRCGNGHIALSEKIIFHYKQSEYYGGQGSQFNYSFVDFVERYQVRLPFSPRTGMMSSRDTFESMSLGETLSWLYPEGLSDSEYEKFLKVR